jgi:hypothetical protein
MWDFWKVQLPRMWIHIANFGSISLGLSYAFPFPSFGWEYYFKNLLTSLKFTFGLPLCLIPKFDHNLKLQLGLEHFDLTSSWKLMANPS